MPRYYTKDGEGKSIPLEAEAVESLLEKRYVLLSGIEDDTGIEVYITNAGRKALYGSITSNDA